MKRFLSGIIIFFLIYFVISDSSFATEQAKVSLFAEKLDKSSVAGEINDRLLKKYIPVKLTVINKSKDSLILSDKIFYIDKQNKEHKISNINILFQNTKKHPFRRAVLVGIPSTVLTLGLFSLPAISLSLADSISCNDNLENNIEKTRFTPHHLFENESYSSYIFVPYKYKNIEQVIIKNLSFENNEDFDLKTKISEENL